MKHHEIRHKLSEYIDGSVTAMENAEIEKHLQTCTVCNDALRELKKTIEYIKAVDEVEPPAWMAQKTMAKVRAEAEQKQGFFHRLFLPLHVKLPIQAVAVLFLAATAFYIYRNIQPTAKFEEIQTEKFSPEKKAAGPAPRSLGPSPEVNAKGELSKAKDSSLRSKQVPQTPEYKALDMRQEYESPPAPAKPAEQPAQAKKEAALDKHAAAPRTAAPAMIQKQVESAAGPSQQAESKYESLAPGKETKGLLNRREERGNFEKVIVDRHPNGKPKLIASYKIINSHKVQIAEERFNKDGERHGIQKEYYDSGRVKIEAQYEYGKLDWYMEFYPDGVKRIGKTDYDWFWLKN